ncbi:ATP-binding protein [Enterococcus faecalis]|uniref:ATP-binding protein n=1 Tax=Enterococcus faecalis TaxID=1351 RepID=UPI0007E5A8E0|nr:ATP-binding protein [Enterococcus faecalis]
MDNTAFKMRFDKNTIDHLGIKLYSSFPPVIVEMISNSYDADAENVEITIDYGKKEVVIKDDGNGMGHSELNNSYLIIGRNRRTTEGTDLSKIKKRPVTGKKGLGKLAVFGIANSIEVISIKDGFKNGFKINYSELKYGAEGEYKPDTLFLNEQVDETNGTTITIKENKQKNLMPLGELAVSISRRFSFFEDDFNVTLVNQNTGDKQKLSKGLYFDSIDKEFCWSFPEDFESEMETISEFKILKGKGVNGKIYTKNTPLQKRDSGFLLYVRNKLASENIFFNDRANDTFNSYVTGFFNVDYIDESLDEDFISTARQSILWEDNEEIEKLRNDLNKVVMKVSNEWRNKRKAKKEKLLTLDENFFDGLSPVERSSILKVRDTLLKNSTEIDDIDYIQRILDSMTTLYKFESFQSYIQDIDESELTFEKVEKITADWEYIESKELAKVATGRIQAIEKFEEYVRGDASEVKVIQPFLEKFPWILDPRITTFERELNFAKILKNNFPDEELEGKNRRLDFLCNLVNGELIIIELKRPSIKISLKEILQARDYERFLLKNHREAIEKGVKTYLISDRYDMNDETRDTYESFENDGKLYIRSYSDLLNQAKQYNKEFINKFNEVRETYNK